MAETVIQHVLRRLKEIGIDDVFGVAGDYAFPVNDAIVEDPALNWISCCNELNAAYAADGYARARGVAALCTMQRLSIARMPRAGSTIRCRPSRSATPRSIAAPGRNVTAEAVRARPKAPNIGR